MNDSHFAMSIYEEAGDVYFKGHRNQMASVPFYRVSGRKHRVIMMWGGFFHSELQCFINAKI